MGPRARRASAGRTTAESLREYGRGVAGGLLFSLPLLYTGEVWWAGFTMEPPRQLAYVVTTFVLLLGYNRFAGLRPDTSWTEIAIDSVEELGLGLLLSAFILYILGRIGPEQHIDEILGCIVVQATTIAIGVSVGTAQLGGGESDAGITGADKVTFGGQLVLGCCGAVLFAANVAPTEEVVVLGSDMSPLRLLGLTLISFFLGAIILHHSDFRGAERWVRADTLSAVLRGTVVTYAIALSVSAAILWLFGRLDGVGPALIVGQTVVLGLPATLGASAGRLLLQ
ncbi:MAG: TIGR02587 family membrane protein [Gemmatimonadota bacterium]|nr:TIGR02587 family membrane protein [Gemmatimonadota bacterium]